MSPRPLIHLPFREDQCLTPLLPLHEDQYTYQELRARLQWINEILQQHEHFHNRRPQWMALLSWYKTNVILYCMLRGENVSAKLICLSHIIEFDRLMQEIPRLMLEQDELYVAFSHNYHQLFRLHLLANYGDYFEENLEHLRRLAQKDDNLEASRTFQGYWEDVLPQFRTVTDLRKKFQFDKASEHEASDLYDSIMKLTADMKLTAPYVEKCMELYVERNDAVHRDMEYMLREQNFSDLAQMLGDDRASLRKIVGIVSEDERSALIAILDSIIERWFTIPEGCVDKPKAWSASPLAHKLGGDLRAKEQARTAALSREKERRMAKRIASKDPANADQVNEREVSETQPRAECEIMLIERQTQLRNAIKRYGQALDTIRAKNHNMEQALQTAANQITSDTRKIVMSREDVGCYVDIVAEHQETSREMREEVHRIHDTLVRMRNLFGKWYDEDIPPPWDNGVIGANNGSYNV